ISPDARFIAGCGTSGPAHAWDLDARARQRDLGDDAPAAEPVHVALAPDGRTLATRAEDGVSLRLWNLEDGAPAATIPGERGGPHPSAIAFDPSDGKRLARGNDDGTIEVLDLAGGGRSLFLGQLQGPSAIAVLAGGERFVALVPGQAVPWVCSIASGARGEALPPLAAGTTPSALAVTRDGERLAIAARDGTVAVFSPTATADCVVLNHGGRVRAVAFGGDGRLVVTAGGEDVKLWSAADGALVRRFDAPADEVAVTPDGRWVATARAGEKEPLLWNVRTGVVTRDFAGHRAGVVAMAMSPDGAWLATASRDETLRLWEVATGREKRRLGAKVLARCLAWSPDGRLVAAGADGPERVSLYDAATGAEVGTHLTGAGEVPQALAFTPDGRGLVAGTPRKELLISVPAAVSASTSAPAPLDGSR
ncbi:MAG TPA: hypothetical protein VHF22_06135, partial [Planctomycetota bacterium]|nr:hypothetical protein [Planctomycetota bacterium]